MGETCRRAWKAASALIVSLARDLAVPERGAGAFQSRKYSAGG